MADNLLTRYAKKVGKKIGYALSAPLAKKTTYDFRTPAEKAAQSDPKSLSYRKNLVDRVVDRTFSY